jgi:hypothetical protein
MEVWVWTVLMIVVEFVATEAVAQDKLVVAVHRVGDRCLLHVSGLVERQHCTAVRGAANTVELQNCQLCQPYSGESMEGYEMLAEQAVVVI